MNDDNLRAASERGRQFKEWCTGNDGLYAVITAMRADYMQTWATTDIADHGTRERIYARVCVLNDLERVLKSAIDAGHSASAMIANAAKLEQRKTPKRQPV